ncbi:hypothetical protein AB1Y20_015109 [Prymnesium parvum]|uniref:Senescence domain-containing protein n=1 Tax=Prymnesium parvum TaxID=97485 RepID=A0AB34K0H2_PRYPA
MEKEGETEEAGDMLLLPPGDDSRPGMHLVLEVGDILRYNLGETGSSSPAVLQGSGVLFVYEGGVLCHVMPSQQKNAWVFSPGRDGVFRWAHPTQWEGSSLGLIVGSYSSLQRTLIIFQTCTSSTDDIARSFEEALGKRIMDPHPDPPRWAASFACALNRSSLSLRENMENCGSRTGREIHLWGVRKRTHNPPTDKPKAVHPVLMGTARGVRTASGAIAHGVAGVVHGVHHVASASGGLVYNAAKPPLRPVLESQAGLATTAISGATLSSIGSFLGGAGSCLGSIVTLRHATALMQPLDLAGNGAVEDVRHTHGDEMATLAGAGIESGIHVGRASAALHTLTAPSALASGAAHSAGVAMVAKTTQGNQEDVQTSFGGFGTENVLKETKVVNKERI